MKLLRRLLAAQPLVVATVVAAAVDLAIAYGLPLRAEAKAPLIALVTAAAALFVHQAVASPATVAAVTRDVAGALSDTTAGTVGTVTEDAAAIVDTVVKGAGGLIADLVPTRREHE